MGHGICIVAVAPMRKEAKDTSEMVSQLIFGEKVEVLEKNNKWCYVRLLFDDYKGWIDEKQIEEMSLESLSQLPGCKWVSQNYDFALWDFEVPFPLTLGAELYLNENQMQIGNQTWVFDGDVMEKVPTEHIIPLALRYLNTPYIWGGKSTYGIDCSGFTQQVYKFCGIALPRDAYEQAECGETINFLEEVRAGDLAFFHNDAGKIIHVGILIDSKTIVHAHGKVRIDKIDHTGIFNIDSKTHSHRLRVIKRVY